MPSGTSPGRDRRSVQVTAPGCGPRVGRRARLSAPAVAKSDRGVWRSVTPTAAVVSPKLGYRYSPSGEVSQFVEAAVDDAVALDAFGEISNIITGRLVVAFAATNITVSCTLPERTRS